MNIFILSKVRQAILDHPQQYYQNDWDCGTTACIAGWAGRITNQRIGAGVDDLHRVQRVLKLDDAQWDRLVHLDNWPEPFKSYYMSGSVLPGSITGAEIAAARIDHFISTNGSE